jgi:dihydrolipoamide dehydrogenase
VDIAEVAAIAVPAGMKVDQLARVPLAFPTYAGILVNAAVLAARQLNVKIGWQAQRVKNCAQSPARLSAAEATAA